MLRVDHLSIAYKKVLFEDAHIEIDKGKITSFIGESGCGKSTLLKFIIGEGNSDKGELYYNHERINDDNISDFLFNHVSYIDQNASYFPNMTIKDHFLFYSHLHHLSLSDNDIKDILHFVDLDFISINNYPHTLSTGERRRFLMAIAFMLKKDIIILDEPSASLEKKNIDSLLQVIDKLCKEGITFIIATHDDAMTQMSHVVYRIENHKCLEIKREGTCYEKDASIHHLINKKIFYFPYKNTKLILFFITLILLGCASVSLISKNSATFISLFQTQNNLTTVHKNNRLFLTKSLDPRYSLDYRNLISDCIDNQDWWNVISNDEIENIKKIDGVKQVYPTIHLINTRQESSITVYQNDKKLKEVSHKATSHNQTFNRNLIITGYYPEESSQNDNGIYINDLLAQMLDVSSYNQIKISFNASAFSHLNYDDTNELPVLFASTVDKNVTLSIDGLLKDSSIDDGRFIDYGRIYMPMNKLNQLIQSTYGSSLEYTPRQYLILCEDGKDEVVKLEIEKMNDLYHAESEKLTEQSVIHFVDQQNKSSLLLTLVGTLALFSSFMLLMNYYVRIRQDEVKLMLREGIKDKIRGFFRQDDYVFVFFYLIVSVIFMEIQIYYMGLMKSYIVLNQYRLYWILTTLVCIVLVFLFKAFFVNRMIERFDGND